jgi:hypothetical protein
LLSISKGNAPRATSRAASCEYHERIRRGSVSLSNVPCYGRGTYVTLENRRKSWRDCLTLNSVKLNIRGARPFASHSATFSWTANGHRSRLPLFRFPIDRWERTRRDSNAICFPGRERSTSLFTFNWRTFKLPARESQSFLSCIF